jgi:hypothetical protein
MYSTKKQNYKASTTRMARDPWGRVYKSVWCISHDWCPVAFSVDWERSWVERRTAVGARRASFGASSWMEVERARECPDANAKRRG